MIFCRSIQLLLIYSLGWWVCVTCSDILSLLRSDIGDFCITNSSSALYYTLANGIVKEETQLIPAPTYFCNFEDNAGCTSDFTKDSVWKRVNSLEYENIPIFDIRWGDLPIKTLSRKEHKTLLKFNDTKNFSITLSVKASEVEFFFCNTEVLKTAFCYWFFIREKTPSCIFKKSGSLQPPTIMKDLDYLSCGKGEYPERDEPLIETNKWRHLTLEKRNQDIYLKTILNGVPKTLLHYEDEGEMVLINYLLGASDSTAHCKIHKYNYLRTTNVSNGLISSESKAGKVVNDTICLSVFLTTCVSCSMEVVAYSRQENVYIIVGRRTLPPSYGNWAEHKILFHNVTRYGYTYLKFGFRTFSNDANDNNFWSIDNFRYCNRAEYRVSVTSTNKLKNCELLVPSKSLMWQKATDVQSTECKSMDLLGGLCIPCNEQNGINATCQNLRFCEIINDVEECFCQSGFIGPECQEECQEGTFGKGCRQECGNCSLNGKCNKIDGSCQCHPLFEGGRCHLPKIGSILKEPPSVIASHPNSCTIQLVNKEYYGEKEIHWYLPQYQKETSDVYSSVWKDYGSRQYIVENNTIEIKDLEISTKYFIRILVSHYHNQVKYLENSNIPFTICNTTCNEWEESDINITEKNETIFVQIEISKNKCNFTMYSWIIKTTDDIEILKGASRKKIDIKDLPGGNTFQMYFLGPNSKNISKTFETGERAPEPPTGLQSYFLKNNSFGIYWQNPNNTNGILKNFEIIAEIGEEKPVKTFQNASNFSGKENRFYHIQFEQPIPPSEDVKIEVVAFNSMMGKPTIIRNSSYPSHPHLLDSRIFIKNSTDCTIRGEFNTTIGQHKNKNKNHFYIYVLVSELGNKNEDENLKTLERLVDEIVDHEKQLRIAAEFDLNDVNSTLLEFVVGKNVKQNSKLLPGNVIIDSPLNADQFYNITVLIVSEYKQKFRIEGYKTGSSTQCIPKTIHNDSQYAFFLLLIFIPIIVGIIIFRKRISQSIATFSVNKLRFFEVMNTTQSKSNIMESKECTPEMENSVMKMTTMNEYVQSPNHDEDILSKRVNVANLEVYVKEAIESGELMRQHVLFPGTQTQPCTYGLLPENKSKNRYNNLIAYDHSRVKLDKLPGNEYSDYINANFIHGYRVPNAFIATQGPKQSTLEDFWRMIWEKNVKHIIMLANIYESGKKKVEQYWPNINEELVIGNICIKYISVEIFADFEYKKFEVRRGYEVRELEQLHFTSWPDHGVPLYPQSLVPFLRKLLKIRMSSSHPVVIHCSAGVGRTGTILLSDICLRMAAKEGAVDLLYNLQKLRQQRSRMVDNVEQYKLAHLVILETLTGLHTSIPCNLMEQAVEQILNTDEYRTQIDYLKQTQWKDDAMKSVAESDENFVIYPEKNRFSELVPDNISRIPLTRYPENDFSSSYINAVKVDGFRNPERFIVTQTPMPNTLSDFWRLVVEQQTRVVISLNEFNPEDETCCQFIPTVENPELRPVDFILIKLGKTQKTKDYDIHSVQILLDENGKRKMDVVVLCFKLWEAGKELPSNHEKFLSFWEEADTFSRRSKTVLLTCYDGRTASGIYVALSFVIEKIKLEQECDVCLAVRSVRHNRKQFVSSEVQFLFLYEVAVRYMRGFQSYANFQDQ